MSSRVPVWRQAKRIDAHAHVCAGSNGGLNRQDAQRTLAKADQLGIDALCVSRPLTSHSPTPPDVRRVNDVVFEAMAMSPRFLGFCFLNPGYARESLEEIQRCVVDGGMLGIKLYHQYFICDPAQRPVMDRAAELQVPVLMHAGKCTDSVTRASQPRLSNASHFAKAAQMFPETIFIQGHIGGGGGRYPNLFLESSRIGIGGLPAAVAAKRVLFGTGAPFKCVTPSLLKLENADLDAASRTRVAGQTARRLLGLR